MSFEKFEIDSYCVGGRHRSATTKIYADITSHGSKVFIGYCSICNKIKSMTISDNTIQAGGFGNFFKSLGKSSIKVGKKLAKNVLPNPTLALDITANIATAAASRKPKNVLSTLLELIGFYNTGKGLYLGEFL